MIEPKPYVMRNPVQNYAWGTKGKSAFIPNLLAIQPEDDLPYAELWMGAHPKASSEIVVDGNWQNLDFIIRKYPIETLGADVVQRFGKKLPFLFKVLSAGEPLSIQMHPDKEQAKVLHQNDPENYPDENHKPEIAIALDYLLALVGFKPIEQIREVFSTYDGFKEIINDEPIKLLMSNQVSETSSISQCLEKAYKQIILLAGTDPTRFNKIIYRTVSQLNNLPELSRAESLFVAMYEKYGNDIGLISILFFNMVELKEGEAIFTPAGVPHAYIEGNIIECMANSDNVIRAGLTPKFKDVENLLKLTEYKPGLIKLVSKSQEGGLTTYITSADEFVVSSINLIKNRSITLNDQQARILLITNGDIIFKYGNESEIYEKGSVLFVPAMLNNFTICSKNEASLFIAKANRLLK